MVSGGWPPAAAGKKSLFRGDFKEKIWYLVLKIFKKNRACGAKIPLFKGDFKGKIEYFVLKTPECFALAAQNHHNLRGGILVGAKIGLNEP